MLGYAFQASRKSPAFETMFWLASSTISFAFGFTRFRYQATWQVRSYGPGGHRNATGGIERTNTPPSGIAWSWRASATVCGPAFQAWSTRSRSEEHTSE